MRSRTAQGLRGPPRSLGDIMKLGFFHQIRQLISKGMDVECRDSYRRTPLILCAFMEPEDWAVTTAMTLIEQGVTVGERDCFGRNALHYASIYERARLVRVLLRAIDFDLEQTDMDGNTALHYAAMSGNVTVCHLLAQSFQRYRINGTKVNHRGRTSLEEAVAAGNTTCARAIEFELSPGEQGCPIKDVRSEDSSGLRPSSSSFESHNRWLRPLSARKLARPVSAAISDRRGAHFSSSAVNPGRSFVSLRVRASSGLTTRAHSSQYRETQNPLYANGYRRSDELIFCAPEDDFRNKLDYVCKLTNLPYETQIWDHVSMLNSANQSSSGWSDTCSPKPTSKRETGWRLELEQLFKVYEHQCSLSWRAVRKCEKPQQIVDPSPSPEDDDKGKKGRNPNILSKSANGKENSPDLKKRATSTRQRKALNGRASGDGALDTSSESISSGVSSRRRGPERESSAGRPESAASRLRTRSVREASLPQPPPASAVPPSFKPEPSARADTPSRAENITFQVADAKETSLPIKSGSNPVSANPTALTLSVSSPSAQSSDTHTLAVSAKKSSAVANSKSSQENSSVANSKNSQENSSLANSKNSQENSSLVNSKNSQENSSLANSKNSQENSSVANSKSSQENSSVSNSKNSQDNSSVANSKSSQESSALATSSTATKLPKITVVVDKLGAKDSPDLHQQQVDTNRLWVQNPYDGSGDNSEEGEVEEDEDSRD